jgi:hypothetical protein
MELKQEIGCHASRIEKMGEFYSQNGVASIRVYYYMAHDVTIKYPTKLESTEIIDRVETLPVDDVIGMISAGIVNDGESAFAILLALQNISKTKTIGDWTDKSNER